MASSSTEQLNAASFRAEAAEQQLLAQIIKMALLMAENLELKDAATFIRHTRELATAASKPAQAGLFAAVTKKAADSATSEHGAAPAA